MENILELLTEKDDREAFANTKRIASESELSDKYYESLPLFAALLGNEKSYIRTRAFILCCSQAKWDTEGKLRELLPKMFPLFHDKKPTVVRQCLAAVREIAVYRPELCDIIRAETETIDVSVYKDSMAPLIRKDMDELYEVM